MLKSLLMIFFSITLAVAGQLLLKAGMNKIGPISAADVKNFTGTIAAVLSNVQVLSGLALYIISAVVWLVVLSRVNLSFAYPLIGFSYVIVLFASRFMFHEPVTVVRWAGAVFISFGVFLISRT